MLPFNNYMADFGLGIFLMPVYYLQHVKKFKLLQLP